jgi:hypothetical protein
MGLSEHSTYQFPLSLMSCIYTHILAFIKERKVVRMGVLGGIGVSGNGGSLSIPHNKYTLCPRRLPHALRTETLGRT